MLRSSAARLGPDEIRTMSRDEHRQAFLAFVAGLIADFDHYLARDGIDPLRDGATYNLAALWLDDAELAELARELYIVVQPRLARDGARDARGASSPPSSFPPRGRVMKRLGKAQAGTTFGG